MMGNGLRRAAIGVAMTLLCACASMNRQDDTVWATEATFRNPVISGFAPDPSIARVGSDFYLVNSSFEYFPGLPIYHSRDLVNWTLISYALTDPQALEFGAVESSGGIHAATIRHHNGVFYVVTTTILAGEPTSFILTADDPRGPWSAPHILEAAEGIDPSLLFDDDGRVWYTANRHIDDPDFPGQAEIWLQELDLDAMKLTGPRHALWRGCCQGAHAEGPHLYKRDGTYYLLIAEGGTSYEHAVSIASASQVTGPYVNNPRNPVLTHRHLSYDHPVTGVGHADLVELEDGRWYAVALGWRLIDAAHGTLGRETYLLPVTWEREREWWKDEKATHPVFSPRSGRIDLAYPLPFENAPQRSRGPLNDTFDAATLGLEWNTRRAPATPFHDLTTTPGALTLRLQPGHIAETAQYSFLGVRQRDFAFQAETTVRFTPATTTEEAGLAIVQNDRAALLFTIAGGPDAPRVRVARSLYEEVTELASAPIDTPRVQLRVVGDHLAYRFFMSTDGRQWRAVGDEVDGAFLSPNTLRGFNYTGVYVGVYGSSNGAVTENAAQFDAFTYEPRGSDAAASWARSPER